MSASTFATREMQALEQERPDGGQQQDRNDGFGKTVAVAIAAVSLLAAVAGFLQSQAGSMVSDAARAAQAYSVEAADATVRSREQSFAAIDTWTLGLEQRVSAANISPELAFAPTDQTGTLLAAQQAARALADRTAGLSGIDVTAADGPRTDPTVLWSRLAGLARESFRLEALQDAQNELGSNWGRQVSTYNAALAILAVSLYLLGLSLTIDVRRARRLLAVTGVLLAVLAGSWTGIQAARAPTGAPDAAADAYADGMVALAGAATPDDYRRVVASMTTAIGLRPTFARAYATRASAELAADSPEQSLGASFITLFTDATLAAGAADYEQALNLGLDDTLVLWNLGALRFHQAIRGDPAKLDEGIALTQLAITRTPDSAVLYYNLGIELLAAGRGEEATQAYEDAIAHTVYADVALRTPRANTQGEMSEVASALTSLEVLKKAKPELATAADTIAARIVAAVGHGTTDTVTAPAIAAVSGLGVDFFPSFLQWHGNLTGADNATLSVLWWYGGTDGSAWSVIPGLSQLAATATKDSQPNASSTHFGQAQFTGLTRPAKCLPAGSYRVELYADGRRIGTADASAPAAYQAFSARDIGAVFCYPPGWTVDPASELGSSGIVTGPSGDRGAGIMHLQLPKSGAAPADIAKAAMDQVETTLAGRLGSTPAAVAGQEYAATVMDLAGGTQRWASYNGGFIVLSAGVDADGSAYVSFAYGPKAWFDTEEWSWVMVSFRRVE